MHLTPDERGQGHVVILSFAHSGAEHVQEILARQTQFACTSGTGVIPMCSNVLAIWRGIDGRAGRTSGLAMSSTRALAGTQITIILARTGGSRWCELATTSAEATAPFLELFPQARVVCVHRACTEVIAAAIRSNPWGSAGFGIAEHTAAFPGNTAAALAAYWADRTEGLLSLEDKYPERTIRTRYEDVLSENDRAVSALCEFLALDNHHAVEGKEIQSETASTEVAGLPMPAELIPPGLRERVARIHEKLGYPTLPWQ